MNELSNYIEISKVEKSFNSSFDLMNGSRIIFHPDIIDYLWIGTEEKYKYIYIDDIIFSEPSFININLPIEITNDLNSVEKLDYYPNYANLTPIQRYKYLKYLENPFNSNFEIGYTFIFFYGLERFMYTENYAGALSLVIRLLEIYNENHSFVSYAVESILFKAIEINDYSYLNRILVIENVVNSLFPSLRTYIYYKANKELSADDIILLSKDVGWKKKTYLNEYRDLFVKNLEIVKNEYESAVSINSLIGNRQIENLPSFNVCRIANITADYNARAAKLPNLLLVNALKDNVFNLMEKAHIMTKNEVAKLRKNGKINQKIITVKFKEIN